MISEGKFKIFDSHSRDLYGMPDPGGKCVLIDVEGLVNLPLIFEVAMGTCSLEIQNYPLNLLPLENFQSKQ